MAYDDSSFHGDLICDNYPEENNIMNPPNDSGWFLYNLEGKSFDYISDLISQLSLDLTPVRCDNSYLPVFGEEVKLKKDPAWTDEQYRALILIRWYNIMTVKGLETVLNKLYFSVLDESTGYITCDYSKVGFRVSNENIENELVSNETVENDLLTSSSGSIIHINVPLGVDTSLIEFLMDYLPYEVLL